MLHMCKPLAITEKQYFTVVDNLQVKIPAAKMRQPDKVTCRHIFLQECMQLIKETEDIYDRGDVGTQSMKEHCAKWADKRTRRNTYTP